MADWNPSLYLKFADERTRPAAELTARIAQQPVKLAVDLGCGQATARPYCVQRGLKRELLALIIPPPCWHRRRKRFPIVSLSPQI